ncbi:hypothetical protein CC78DRAFT_586661 [Lojkania enalia]|uniref:Peptidase S8/S53 domain-containing protein n=1 Tax=Lojkania enalia TaxID=147567 RepID=A0A9P4MVB9_9PLEO|nr:hypothetical protein CC78DRAFT_586661 [Didymosphaeria enalia]
MNEIQQPQTQFKRTCLIQIIRISYRVFIRKVPVEANSELVAPGLEQSLAFESEYEAAEFYDDEKPYENHSSEECAFASEILNWEARPNALYENFIEPHLQDSLQFPVKIGVFDSGVDETNNALDTEQIQPTLNLTNKFKKTVHDHNGRSIFTASLLVATLLMRNDT